MGSSSSAPPNPFGPGGWKPSSLGRQDGKTFVITGTTTGCGFEAARLLVSKGGKVVMLNRNEQRSAEIAKEFGRDFPGAEVVCVKADLASLASVRTAAEEVLRAAGKIDALICNAAIAQVATQQLTVDGFESQLGVNHYAHFLLIGLLWQRIEESKARVVVVGSNGYKMGTKKMKFEDLNWDSGYSDFNVYCQSKLAQTIFAYELQRRVAGAKKDVLVQVCHPGASRTELAKEEASCFMATALKIFAPMGQSAEQGSWPEVMCATEENLKSETYYGPTERMEMVGAIGECPLEAHALDKEAAQRLWSISEEKTGLKWSP